MKKLTSINASLLLLISLSAGIASANEKDLKRTEDPVVLGAALIGDLLGSQPAQLSLMTWNNNSWSAIPFQIDQKKPDGSYAFTMGPEASDDPDPLVDENDELVFMAKDTGDQVQDQKTEPWPDNAVSGVEIQVTDPKNGSRGWAYLFRFDGPGPRSNVDYIKLEIDQEKGYRLGTTDRLIVGSPIDRVYPDLIAQIDPATLKPGKDVLDRMKIRGELVFPLNITIPFNADELIKCRDTGYIDGSVRVLHQAWGFMEVIGIEFKGMGYSTLSYYPNHVIVPVTIEADAQVPDWLMRFIPKGRVAGYMDFNSNISGSHVLSEANPYNEEVVLDGKMSDAENALDLDAEIDWIGGFGPEGGLLCRLILDQRSRSQSKMVTYFRDDANAEDEPEDHPGVSSVGFDISGKDGEMNELARNSTFRIYVYVKRDLRADNVHTLLDILDHPLETRTTALNISK